MDAKTHIQSTHTSELEEVRLGDLIRIAWHRKWLIVFTTIGFGVAGAILTQVVPKKYSATIVVDPVTNSSGLSQMGGFSSIASEFGGLASLVGLHIGQENSMRADTLAFLQSRELTEKFIADNNLLPILYAGRWDAATHKWRTNNIPTLWKANEYFKSKIREVDTNHKTGLVTLRITWTNPTLAAAWANGLVNMTNDYLRQKAIDEAERNIAYLTEQASKTDVVGIKQVIYALMESQISEAMLARGNQEYALKTIDPAQAPERPTSPKPALWIIASLFIGAFISFLIALLKAEFPTANPASKPVTHPT